MKLLRIEGNGAESLDAAALAGVLAQFGTPADPADAEPLPDRIQMIDALGNLVWTNEPADAPFAVARYRQAVARSWPEAARGDIEAALAAARRTGSGSFAAVTREGGRRHGWNAVVSRLGGGSEDGSLILVAHCITAGAAARESSAGRAAPGDRTSLFDRLDRLVTDGTRLEFALVIFDIDRFARLNERTSHACGDIVLRLLGERLQAGLGDGEFAAIMGSDEFAVVLPATDPAEAAQRTRAILDALAAPLLVDRDDLACTLSAGYALFPAMATAPTTFAATPRRRSPPPRPRAGTVPSASTASSTSPGSSDCRCWRMPNAPLATMPSSPGTSPRSISGPGMSPASRPCCAGAPPAA